jgi:hypothetical protein
VGSGPAGRVVTGLVADQGEGDLVGPVRHRAADHAAVFAAGPQLLAVPLRGRVAVPQTDTEIDQGPSQRHAAFPADAAVAASSRGLILDWGQAGGAIQLRGARPPIQIPDRGRVVRSPHCRAAGHGEQRRERGLRQQCGDRGFCNLHLLIEAGQQAEIGREDLAGSGSARGRQRLEVSRGLCKHFDGGEY